MEAGTRHPPQFSMRVCSCANEFGPHGYNEIPAHTPPHEVEVIVVSPDICPCTGDGIDVLLRIVLTATGDMDGSDIGLILKRIESKFIG
jgi:hypothetical protein